MYRGPHMACDMRSSVAGGDGQSSLRQATAAVAVASAIEASLAQVSNDMEGGLAGPSDRPVQPATAGSTGGDTAGHGSGLIPSSSKTTAMVFPNKEGKDACRGFAPFWPGPTKVFRGAIDAPHPEDGRHATNERSATTTFLSII